MLAGQGHPRAPVLLECPDVGPCRRGVALGARRGHPALMGIAMAALAGGRRLRLLCVARDARRGGMWTTQREARRRVIEARCLAGQLLPAVRAMARAARGRNLRVGIRVAIATRGEAEPEPHRMFTVAQLRRWMTSRTGKRLVRAVDGEPCLRVIERRAKRFGRVTVRALLRRRRAELTGMAIGMAAVARTRHAAKCLDGCVGSLAGVTRDAGRSRVPAGQRPGTVVDLPRLPGPARVTALTTGLHHLLRELRAVRVVMTIEARGLRDHERDARPRPCVTPAARGRDVAALEWILRVPRDAVGRWRPGVERVAAITGALGGTGELTEVNVGVAVLARARGRNRGVCTRKAHAPRECQQREQSRPHTD